MADRPILHPATLSAALDGEAEAWAVETDLAGWVARLSSDPATRTKLMQICKQMFAEGVYRGALNVIDGKSLAESILAGRAAAGGFDA